MTKNVVSLEEDIPISFVINYINKFHYGRFPVLNKDKALVGIITNRDIVNRLFVEMNREMARLEEMIPENKDMGRDGDLELQFLCHQYDFENAGKASAEIKRILKERDVERGLIRRVAVASYELEINLIIHALGGRVLFRVSSDAVEIVVRDRGPGIEELDSALTEGFSTAGDWIRSLGFGAGMGLPNVKRVSDEFAIKSKTDGPDKGTIVHVKIFIKT